MIAAPASAASTLAKMDGYLAATGHADTHPWRVEIAASLVLPESTDVIVCAPYSSVHIPMRDAEDHAILKAKQLAFCIKHMPVGAYSEPIVQLARRLADELVLATRAGNGAALLIGQLDDILRLVAGDAGHCDVVWMCRQLVDEVQETVFALDAEKASQP
jgi:hypothetical protein